MRFEPRCAGAIDVDRASVFTGVPHDCMTTSTQHGIIRKAAGEVSLAVLLVLLLAGPVRGQAPAPSAPPSTPGLLVFLDCDRGCDFEYLRQEATFVDYVRDPRDAQVHVLVTRQRTGGGGREYRL